MWSSSLPVFLGEGPGGAEPETVAVGLGSQRTPRWHRAPSLESWVPAVEGRSQPGQVRSLPRPQAGGWAGPPSFLPPCLGVADRQVWASC